MAETPIETLKEKLERRRGAMQLERSSFIAHYKSLAEFIQPRRGRFLTSDRNRGEPRHQKIINSAASQAIRIAKAGLLAGIMSPTRPWFSLETIDTEQMEVQENKVYLDKCETILRDIFNASNLYNQAPIMLGEMLLFATGAMLHVDDFNDVARFYTMTAGSYMIAQDDRQVVNTFVREYEATVDQLVREFGLENCNQAVKDAYAKKELDTWFQVVHFIDERPAGEPGQRFRSTYYQPGNADQDKDLYLSQGGYDIFPVYCPRWEVTGEDIYGTECPGMIALGDVKGLQIEERRKAQAIDKMVNPPLKGPAVLKNMPVSSLPGGTNFYDGDGGKGLEPVYTVDPQLNGLMLDIKAVEERINKAFYVDMFMAITNMQGIQPRNEMELSYKDAERLLQLGPVLERFHGEFLTHLINRTFTQAHVAKILPTPPKALQGQRLKIKYVSALAMAQRAIVTGGVDRLATYVTALAKFYPEVVDKFDADQSVDIYAHAIDVPPSLVVPDDVVAERRAERARLQKAAQAAELAASASETAQTLGETTAEPGTALGTLKDAMVQQMEGA